jgi:hypothetical protein
MTALDALRISPAHREGHFLYELRDTRGEVVAKIAATPELVQDICAALNGRDLYLQWESSGGQHIATLGAAAQGML